VLDQLGVAVVGEASGELADDACGLLDLAEQQGAAIGGDIAAIEGGEDLAGPEGGEVEVGDILCAIGERDRGRSGGAAGVGVGWIRGRSSRYTV
jgi:hypothetical protein